MLLRNDFRQSKVFIYIQIYEVCDVSFAEVRGKKK